MAFNQGTTLAMKVKNTCCLGAIPSSVKGLGDLKGAVRFEPGTLVCKVQTEPIESSLPFSSAFFLFLLFWTILDAGN